MLKYIRQALAVVAGAIFLYAFLAVSNSDSVISASGIAKSQFMPALMAGSICVLVLLVVVTLLFGRVYCSVLCPLGIMQDFIDRVIKVKRKVLKWKKKRVGYIKPRSILRYTILALAAISVVLGIGFVTNLLDPYSIFGLIQAHLVRPIIIAANNFGASILNSMDNYSLYAVSNGISSISALIIAIVLLVVITVMVFFRQRLWCNTICPVGTLLGLLSKVSIFKIVLDSEKCNKCKACSTSCKSNCIDESVALVDNSRCVACFNCIDKCKKGAISFKFAPGLQKNSPKVDKPEAENSEDTTSRREFIALVASGSIMPAVGHIKGKLRLDANRYPMPPGAISLERFQSKCTGCQLCVTKCPSHLLKPALFERGINGFMQPYMSFDVHKFCEFECKACMEVCPNGALLDMPIEEKKLVQVGIVQFDIRHCVVEVQGVHCGACSEHCPTQAVFMADYKNGLTIPTLNQEICIGCGACESICPVRPKAIYISGCEEQHQAKPFSIEKTKEIEVDGFGF